MSYAGKRVLVTGADGFIGSHLAERLVSEGAQVRAFCLYNSEGSCGWLERRSEGDSSRLEVRLGDVRDARFVEETCREMEIVFHLAALISIPYSYLAPESFYDTNVRGTLNVLEAVRRHGVRRMVHTSTSEVYGTPDTLPILETHPLNAQSPYAASKMAADQMALAYHRSFGTPVTILRPFNTFGPRQSRRAVTATMLSQLLAGRKEVQLGRLDTKRDLTFVGDVVEGFLKAGSVPKLEGEVIQLGTGRAVSIGELFEMACRATGVKASAVQDARRLRPEASEVMVLQSDPGRAKEKLGWHAAVSLEDGLCRTVEWMREQGDRYGTDFHYV